MAGIYRRGKTWWGRVQRQGREFRRSLGTTSESVGRKRLKEWLDALERVAWGEKPRYTFDDLAEHFMDRHLPRLRPRSARRYLTSIGALTRSFAGLHLDEINAAKLAEFEDRRRREGAHIPDRMLGHKHPKAIKSPTIRRDLACLSSMFGHAIEIEWTDLNPVGPYLRRARQRGLREAAPRRRYLTVAEEVKLLAAAGDKLAGPHLHAAIALAIDTGLRRDELFGLTRPQVSLERNEIRLTDGTKTARLRNVPLLPRAREILAHLPAQLRSPFVLVNPTSRDRYRHMNRGLAGAAARAGIEPLVWHDLRRTCGCRLLQARGLSMHEVSRWLGHSSIVTTERIYAFLEDEHLQKAIATGTRSGTGAPDIG